MFLIKSKGLRKEFCGAPIEMRLLSQKLLVLSPLSKLHRDVTSFPHIHTYASPIHFSYTAPSPGYLLEVKNSHTFLWVLFTFGHIRRADSTSGRGGQLTPVRHKDTPFLATTPFIDCNHYQQFEPTHLCVHLALLTFQMRPL